MMGLQTQFVHGGELVPLRWGWWHVQCFAKAYQFEQGEDATPLADLYEYTFINDHEFTDPGDGEVLTIVVGDVFRWWRDR